MNEVFEDHRNLLFAVAYRMLGTVADAEDVVQDAWLNWTSADRSHVAEPKGYLVRIATNLALDRLRSARVQRESYVGPWLPEPLLTAPDVAEDVELAESVSMAMLVVLETLSPLERAVFVLREVFGFPHGEIAQALGRSESSVRQLGHRAREHVQARRPRFETGAAERRQATDRFFAAALGGDLNELMEVLAPDVTLWTDGGGKVRAALRTMTGAERVARWLAAVAERPYDGVAPEDIRLELAEINGVPGVLIKGPHRLLGTVTVDVDSDGRAQTIHLVANPDKLRPIAEGRELQL
ncbi:RNA polymerase sigma-70 factor [Actinomadura alba]|uniref:RNA polymerase sigma-70 factor n=1 Tax=Actinomadura alba TaxID=406431 RepID=A0ABR7M1U0_9ACTN|nr:RNA polymerase sigma-70 factor [Actinomadura alba]MBC6470695.1 RNA polymerase sigma-70 factor [Actinomadura alba]